MKGSELWAGGMRRVERQMEHESLWEGASAVDAGLGS